MQIVINSMSLLIFKNLLQENTLGVQYLSDHTDVENCHEKQNQHGVLSAP